MDEAQQYTQTTGLNFQAAIYSFFQHYLAKINSTQAPAFSLLETFNAP